MNFLDIVALAILGISVVTALVKGLIVELLALGGTIAGLVCAFMFYPVAAGIILRFDIAPMLADLLGFLAIFIGLVVLSGILSSLANKLLKFLNIKWFDRLLGGAFGFARGYLINLVIFLALTAFPVSEELLRSSQLREFFLSGANILATYAPGDMRAKFEDGLDYLHKKWDEIETETVSE